MPNHPHVLFVVNNYPPHIGGVQVHVQSLAKKLVERGARATVVTLSDFPQPEVDEDGVIVWRLPRHFPVGDVISFPRPGATRAITRWASTREIDAVSVHTRFFPMSAVGVRVAGKLGVPVIHTEHGSNFVRAGSTLIDAASRGYDLTLGRYVLRRADKVLAVSEQAAAFAERLSGRTAEVFYNSIDVATYTAAREDPRPRRLIFIGRLVPGKGWEDALAAYRALAPEHPGLSLDIVGGGPQLDQARQLTAAEPGVAVRGRVDPREIPALLAGATLLNPTTLSEGFQTTLLECLAAGGRVVTYDVPGAQELAALGPQVVIVPSAMTSLTEGTRSILTNPPSDLDPQQLMPWDWTAQAERYEEIAYAAGIIR